MFPTDFRRAATAALCALGLAAGLARAGDAPSASPFIIGPTPLLVSMRAELPNRVPPYYRAYLIAGTNQFAFIIPEGLQARTEPGQAIVRFTSPEGCRLVSFAILQPASTDSPAPGPDVYHELLQNRHPTGKFTQDFTRPMALGAASVYDMQWKGPGDIMQCSRTVFVATSFGLLEIDATSNPEKFADLQTGLNLLLSTFRASKDGKLEVSPMSDRL